MRSWHAALVCGLIVGSLTASVDAQTPLSVWGDVELRGYFTGERMAPNGHAFDPLFALKVDLQIGRPDLAYVFLDSVFWGQKATTGITNDHSGAFDFSKREFDLLGGVAGRPLAHWDLAEWELRGLLYSLNNLNRGSDKEKPSGFEDGGGVGGRYYWGRRSYGHQNYVGVGYFFGHLVDQAGQQFTPGFYGELGLYYDFWRMPEQASLFLEAQFVAESPATAKLLNTTAGVAVRPFRSFLNFELRLGVEGVYDFDVAKGRALPYAGIAVTW